MRAPKPILTLALLGSLLGVMPLLAGCGAGPQPMATDEMKKDEDSAKTVRALFDANKGEWSSLSQDVKNQATKAYGGDAKRAETVWGLMLNPPTGAPMPPEAPPAAGR